MSSSTRPTKPQQILQNPVSPPSSASSSSRSALSPPQTTSTTSSATIPASPTSTMEELWKDINPSPLQHPHTHHPGQHNHPSAAGREGMIFQDFLGPPPPTAMLGHPASHYGLGSSLSSSPGVNPAPVTVLRLNSGPEFHFLDSSSPLRSSSGSSHFQNGLANVSSGSFNCCPFDGLANSPPVLPCFGSKKRGTDSDSGSGDRLHKRMIKNRESAARSRARKQAYTNELELEVAHLMEENAKLKKQQEQLCMAAASQLPKKHTLHRSSTAPF
ncbi:protein FD [Punica granatum]|uniref:Protein FD n=1 Tax=Punica granatum TaxID=22663 RepID=A0A6P8CP62_PUNGR|nr:protein FD [Punica granatum]